MKKVLVMLVLVVEAFFAPTISNRVIAQTQTVILTKEGQEVDVINGYKKPDFATDLEYAKNHQDTVNVLVRYISSLKSEMNALSAKLGKKGCIMNNINNLKKGQDSLKNHLANYEKDNDMKYETTMLRLHNDSLLLVRLNTVILPDVYRSMSDIQNTMDSTNYVYGERLNTVEHRVDTLECISDYMRTHAKFKKDKRACNEQRQNQARYNTENSYQYQQPTYRCKKCTSSTYSGSHLIPITDGANQGIDIHSYDYLYKQNYQRLLHVSDNATAINTTFAQPTPRVGLCGDYGCHPCKHRAWITHSFWGGVILASGVAIVTDGVYMSVHHSNNPFYMMGGAKDVPTGL